MKKMDNLFTRIVLVLFLFPIACFFIHVVLSFFALMLLDTAFSFLIWPILAIVLTISISVVLWPVREHLKNTKPY